MTKPNLIVITPHDLGDFVGCYGTPVSTPHLDALAGGGVLFQNHFSTGTVCSPSRGSITTGCYPHTHGLMGLVHRGWALDTERCPPLAQLLRSDGYQTHLFGFEHEHYDPSRLGYERTHATEGTQLVDKVVPIFEEWLRSDAANESPFFAALGFFDVHRFGARPSHFCRDVYEPVDPDTVSVPPWLPDIPEVREELAAFYGDVSHLDLWIGSLRQTLRETGHDHNTLLVFTSDHGASFLHGKATCYDGGTKVPWIMSWPQGIPEGTCVDALTSHVDILPTLLDLLGVPVPEHVQGQSMVDWARGKTGPERPHVFAEKNYTNYYDPTRMARTQGFKYIRKGLRTCVFDYLIPEIEGAKANFRDPRVFTHYSARRCTEELYDLEVDPGELHNLIDDPTYQASLDKIRAALDAHLSATDDPFAQLRNDLYMPEDEYAPAMQHMWRRIAQHQQAPETRARKDT